jgi:hypothetical protein
MYCKQVWGFLKVSPKLIVTVLKLSSCTRQEVKKFSPQEGVFVWEGVIDVNLSKKFIEMWFLKERRISCIVGESTRHVSRIVSRQLSGSSRLYQYHVCIWWIKVSEPSKRSSGKKILYNAISREGHVYHGLSRDKNSHYGLSQGRYIYHVLSQDRNSHNELLQEKCNYYMLPWDNNFHYEVSWWENFTTGDYSRAAYITEYYEKW